MMWNWRGSMLKLTGGSKEALYQKSPAKFAGLF
jgi:hypothetical protein